MAGSKPGHDEECVRGCLEPLSNPLETAMRLGREHDSNRIARADLAAGQNDSHDSRLANKLSLAVAVEHGGQEAFLKTVDLNAGIAQARQFHDGGSTEMQLRANGKGEQVDAARGDVLAHLSGRDGIAFCGQFPEEFRVNEMNLAQVRLQGIGGDAGAVPDRFSRMGVTLDAEPGNKPNALHIRLGE